MKLLMSLLLAATTVLALSSAQASVVSHSGFSRDSKAVVVSGYGQDWLMWDQTLLRSIQWFETSPEASALRTQGWHVAGLTEMQSLFSKFQVRDVNQPGGNTDLLTLMTLFGDVYSQPCELGVESPDDCAYSRVRFKLDAKRTGFAYFELNWETSRGYTAYRVVESGSWWGGHDTGAVGQLGGLALVRDSQITQSVPEPASMALVLLATMGALASRRSARGRRQTTAISTAEGAELRVR